MAKGAAVGAAVGDPVGIAVGVAVGMSVVTLVGAGVGAAEGNKDGCEEGAVVFCAMVVVVVMLSMTKRHHRHASNLVFHIMVFVQIKKYRQEQSRFWKFKHTGVSTVKSSQQNQKQPSSVNPIELCNSSSRLSKQYDKRYSSSSLSLQPGI